MPIVKLPGGSLRDEIREPVFDTIDLVATGAPITQIVRSFFSNVQGKSIVQSNLRQNNLLETAVSFRVMGLAIDVQNFYPLNSRIIPLVMEQSAASLRIGEKVYWSNPMRFAAGRVYQNAAAAVATDYIIQSHGEPAVAGVILEGKHVVDINPLQSFTVDWTLDPFTAAEAAIATLAADTKLRYVCSLKGLKRRPVQ